MRTVVQVINRDKLQRAGEDNLFVRLLYAKDKAQQVNTRDEQEKLGTHTNWSIDWLTDQVIDRPTNLMIDW